MPLNHQISQMADRRLNRASKKITKAQVSIDKGTAEKEAAWNDVLDVFNEFGREMGKARFIARDGYTLQWARREGKDELDPEALKKLVSNAVWEQITTRVVDTTRLEEAVIQGLVSEATLRACMSTKPPTGIRLHDKWSKEDHERAIIYGIPEPSE